MTGAFALVAIVNFIVAIAFTFKGDFHKTVPSKTSWILPLCVSLLFFLVAPNPAIAAGSVVIVLGFRAIAIFFTTDVQNRLCSWIARRVGYAPKRVNRYEKRMKDSGDEANR
ncbi:hypothetical protein [Mycolicibacterium aubagnense]|nr:hypothetical protein [Mycolicibacterium aubagnense]WGI32907.1 hypothetical protein QDT91_00435 [Mycolicibacterium aubagnense]